MMIRDDNSTLVSASPATLMGLADSDRSTEGEVLVPDTTVTTSSSEPGPEPGDATFHLNWAMTQCNERNNRNKWLSTKNQTLGSALCTKAKTLLLTKRAPGVHLSEEQTNEDVSESQNNLRGKKIHALRHFGPQKSS